MKEWWTVKEIADFNFRGLWSNVPGIRRIAAAENWQDATAEWPTNPHGFWRRNKREGKTKTEIEYRLVLIVTQASFLALARQVKPSDPAGELYFLRGGRA